jgi:hypothetical protein
MLLTTTAGSFVSSKAPSNAEGKARINAEGFLPPICENRILVLQEEDSKSRCAQEKQQQKKRQQKQQQKKMQQMQQSSVSRHSTRSLGQDAALLGSEAARPSHLPSVRAGLQCEDRVRRMCSGPLAVVFVKGGNQKSAAFFMSFSPFISASSRA